MALDLVKGQAGLVMDGVPTGEGLPAPDGDIDEARLQFERIRPSTNPLRCQKGGPRSAEAVEHEVATASHVLHRIGDQRHRFDGWMRLQIIEPSSPEGIDPGIVPNIGAGPTMTA